MEDIEHLYQENILNRNKYLDIIASLFNTTDHHLSVSLDGQWGSGKTVFLKELLHISQNEVKNRSTTIQTFYDTYIVIYFDAWEYDKYDDPLRTLLYTLTNTAMTYADNSDNTSIIEDINGILKLLGKTAYEYAMDKNKGVKLLIDNINKEKSKETNQFSQIISIDQQINTIQQYISKILGITNKKKMLIIIDELDRCNPQYAVNLLETTKHLFTENNCHFLFGINKLELSKCIENYYGLIKSTEYLDKIFDLTFSLPSINSSQLKKYVEFQRKENPSQQECPLSRGYSDSIVSLCKQMNLSLREINRTLSILSNIRGDYIANNLTFMNRDKQILYIELFIYLSILKVKDYKTFTEIKNSIDIGITILIDNLNDIETSYKQDLIDHLNHIQEQNKPNNYSESVEDYQTIISMVDFFK